LGEVPLGAIRQNQPPPSKGGRNKFENQPTKKESLYGKEKQRETNGCAKNAAGQDTQRDG
jgi:hypothetical protein